MSRKPPEARWEGHSSNERIQDKALEPGSSLVFVEICRREAHHRCTGVPDQEWEDTCRASFTFSSNIAESGLSLWKPELSTMEHTGKEGKEGAPDREDSICKMKCEHGK